MPAPSARTKPSRSLSKGRLAACGLSLRRDNDFAEVKPPTPMLVMVDSAPPVSITSASPRCMAWKASAVALAAEAQAVESAVLGPHKPKRMETLPGAALGIIFGM